MSNNNHILEAVKGEPGSLTSTAFNTGVIVERLRIISYLESKRCKCIDGYPEKERKYYKTSGNQTRESLTDEYQFYSNHQYCDMLSYKRIMEFIGGETE
jgi:hypothetical protein